MSGFEYPRVGSLESRTLARLLRSERMTHRHFQCESCTYRLAAYVYSLSMKGWPVERRQRASPTNDPAGRKATYTVYYFSLDTIRAAGFHGLQYALKVFLWEERRSREKAATNPLQNNKSKRDAKKVVQPDSTTKRDKDDTDGQR